MSKTLKQFLEVYKPKSPDEQKFVDKHVTIKHKDRNGNGDDVFTASNIKTAKRKEERHGYDVGEDEKVYEETELDEAHAMWKVDYPKQHVGKPIKAGSAHVKAQNTAHAHKVMAKRLGVNSALFKSNVTKSTTLPEEVELDESAKEIIEGLMHDRYERSHGKKARGTGSWAFTTQRYGSPKQSEMHFTSGHKSLSDAHKEAAAKLGTKHLYVMEDIDAEDLDESAKVAAHLIKRYGENVRKSHVRSAANDFGVGYVALSHAVRKKLGVNRLEEDAEQIDELSTSTLKKYRAAAKADAIDADAVDDNRRYNQRAAGYKKAGKVITKRGENMLAKEEAESVEEMAPPGAKYERMVKHIKKGYAKGGLTDRERAIAYATAWKAKKANEGVEYVVPTLEEQLIEKIDSLSESNQETILAVFEKLSEENKAKFVDYCDSPEGVNAMLDFAIDNRGE